MNQWTTGIGEHTVVWDFNPQVEVKQIFVCVVQLVSHQTFVCLILDQ